jgi:hypothetical protein
MVGIGVASGRRVARSEGLDLRGVSEPTCVFPQGVRTPRRWPAGIEFLPQHASAKDHN